MAGPAPAEALAGRDAVVHLAGEDIAAALERRRAAPHPGVARDRHAQPGRGHARGRAAPGGAGLGRPQSATTATARTRSTRTRRPATTSWPRSARPGSARPRTPRSSASASCACAPASCSTATAGALQDDAAAVPARRRRPGGRRKAADAVDPPRGRHRHLPRRDRRRPLERPGQRHRSAAGHQPRVLQGARPRAAPAGDRAGAGVRPQASSTAGCPSWCSRARTPSPAAPSSSGTATGTRTSTRRCAPPCRTLDHRPGVTGKVPRVNASSQDRYEPLPGLLEIPGFLVRKIPPRARKPAAFAGAILLAAVAVALVLSIPAITESKDERAATEARQEREHRAQRAAELQAELRLREGRGEGARGLEGRRGDRRPPGAGRRPRRRRPRRRRSAACSPASSRRASTASSASASRAAPAARTRRSTSAAARGRYSCLAITADAPRIETNQSQQPRLSLPRAAALQLRPLRYCKISGRPGEGSLTREFPVRVPERLRRRRALTHRGLCAP